MKGKKFLILSLLTGALTLNSCSATKERIVYLDNVPPKEDTYKPKEKSIYEKEIQQKVVSLLKAPETPLRTSDVITRVLILPYTKEDGTLIMSHYVFVKMKEGKWILGDYLIDQQKEDVRIVRPLKETQQPSPTNPPQHTPQSSQPNSNQICPTGQCRNINESEAENVRQQMNQMKESMSNMQQTEIQNQENME